MKSNVCVIQGVVKKSVRGDARKAEWVSYEGPQGGSGWQNPDTGEVYYGDSPPGEVITEDSLVSGIDIEFSGEYLSSEQVSQRISDDLSRSKVREATERGAEAVSEVRGGSPMSYYDQSSGVVYLRDDTFDDTVSHEMGHAFLTGNGVEVEDFSNILAITFDGSFPEGLVGRSIGDVAEELVAEGKMAEPYLEGVRDSGRFDDEIGAEAFKVQVSDDSPSEIQSFAEDLNDFFEDQFNVVSEGGVPVVDEYSTTNAHEAFTGVHVEMQRDGISTQVLRDLYEGHPDFLQSYFSVFEPNELQREFFNNLFEGVGGSGGIESVPFPEEL